MKGRCEAHNRAIPSTARTSTADAVIYKFKSKAAGDVIMMGPSGDQVLHIIGKQPAAKGITEPAAMPKAIAALEQAVQDDEQSRREAEAQAEAEGKKLAPRDAVS